jgi:predicted choloylglycine hydrolase
MMKFPMIIAEGDNYTAGKIIGEKLKKEIQAVFQKDKESGGFPLNTEKLIRDYLFYTKKYFPQYIEEMHGIADGSEMNFSDFFFSTSVELFNPDRTAANSNHCTIAAIPNAGGYIIGHNEDAKGYDSHCLYIQNAEISGNRIFGLSYADSLIGSSVAINRWGLVQAINSLPDSDAGPGVPRNIIARAILDCRRLADAEKIISSVPRASGYNHVLVQGDELWNIECSRSEYQIEKIRNMPYVHTNHALTDFSVPGKVPEIDEQDSKDRYNKASQLIASCTNISDLIRLLSDRNYPPISKDITIGSMIIDPGNKSAFIHYGKPGINGYYEVNIGEVV